MRTTKLEQCRMIAKYLKLDVNLKDYDERVSDKVMSYVLRKFNQNILNATCNPVYIERVS